MSDANRPRRRTAMSLAGCCLLALACTDHWDRVGAASDLPGGEVQDVSVDSGGLFPGRGIGEACDEEAECRDGLACRSGRCEPAGDRGLDERCLLAEECGGPGPECESGLTCGVFGFCTCAGTGKAGESCSTAADCARGWRCEPLGVEGYCVPAPVDGGDLGAPCARIADCRAGLVCSKVSGTCVAGSLLLNPDLFAGVACPDESGMPFGVRMRLPGTLDPGEFYSLPFPNDVRLGPDGRPDLADHPRPGGGFLGVDVLDGVLRALEDGVEGFSVNPTLYLRFTRPVDPSTLRTEPDRETGAPATVRLLDLERGTEVPARLHFQRHRGKYLCANALAVHPAWGRSLRPNATHALVVTTDVRSLASGGEAGGGGDAPVPLDDLPMLLETTPPADPRHRRAWDAYAPLRAWMAASGMPSGQVAGAAVFTTGDPRAPLRSLRDLFHPPGGGGSAVEVPSVVAVAECGKDPPLAACLTPGWAETPEGQRGASDPRACPTGKPAGWTEFQVLLRLPVFQEGTPPYRDSGGVLRFVEGRPAVVRTEDVCAAITLPDGEPPASGWPLLIYGHGTGGNFRGAIRWAGDLAVAGVATLSVDGVLHGPRQGAVPWVDPGPLVYNFLHPPAALGNLLQGAADHFSLVRLAVAFEGPLGGRQVRFDRDRIGYMGHSQGATTGGLVVGWEDGFFGAAFTGAGASLLWGLLGKKQPGDASAGLRAAFQELHLDEWHPGLALIQWLFDLVDPLVHAPTMLVEAEGRPLHVLNVLGWDDSYSPWRTGILFGAAAGTALLYHGTSGVCVSPACDLLGFSPDADLGMDQWLIPADMEYGGNRDLGSTGRFTAVTVASRSDGTYDGHFVGERNPATREVVVEFLNTLFDLQRTFPVVHLDRDPCLGFDEADCPR